LFHFVLNFFGGGGFLLCLNSVIKDAQEDEEMRLQSSVPSGGDDGVVVRHRELNLWAIREVGAEEESVGERR
jgi:hypothetical protein